MSFFGFGKQTPVDVQLIESYGVVYKGGLSEYPKEKIGKIDFRIVEDRFEFLPTFGTKSWFRGLALPYEVVTDVQIVERQVGTLEGFLGGLDSHQLNQRNNIHIMHRGVSGEPLVLRVEMLSGITVMGQAAKCKEFEDRLRVHRLREKMSKASAFPDGIPNSTQDIPAQIEKLAALRDKGILATSEFEAKKAELLKRM